MRLSESAQESCRYLFSGGNIERILQTREEGPRALPTSMHATLLHLDIQPTFIHSGTKGNQLIECVLF